MLLSKVIETQLSQYYDRIGEKINNITMIALGQNTSVYPYMKVLRIEAIFYQNSLYKLLAFLRVVGREVDKTGITVNHCQSFMKLTFKSLGAGPSVFSSSWIFSLANSIAVKLSASICQSLSHRKSEGQINQRMPSRGMAHLSNCQTQRRSEYL